MEQPEFFVSLRGLKERSFETKATSRAKARRILTRLWRD
jgi:hypothetical protein